MRNESPSEGFLKNIVVSDWEPKMDTGSPSKGSKVASSKEVKSVKKVLKKK